MKAETVVRWLLSVAVLLCGARAARAGCGAPETCANVVASFYGQVQTESIRLRWTTDSETAAISRFRLLRYSCATPSSCSVEVATVEGRGECGESEEYELEDEPPVGEWVYTLEVWSPGNIRYCAVDTAPAE